MPELTTFASREPATYIRGTVNPDGWATTDAMLEASGLAGWDVRLRVLDSDARRAKETYEVIRTNPNDGGIDRLGTAGERYGIVQNETALHMFDTLSPRWFAAGSFKGGSLIYAQADTDHSIVLDPNGRADKVESKVVVSTTHDGSGALRIGRTNMRLDCLNQFNLMFGKLADAISVRHTLRVDDRLKAIKLAWKENNLYFDAVAAEMEALIQQDATDQQFFGIVAQMMGDRPELNTKGAQTKFDNRLEMFAQAWNGKPNANAKGTAWGVFNALIETNQWGRTIQDTPAGVDNFAMAGMGFDGPTNRFRQDAFSAAKSLLTV